MPASTWSTTDKNANVTLSGSNLIATATGVGGLRGKDPKRTGKYYLEYTSTTTQNNSSTFGFAAAKSALNTSQPAATVLVQSLGGQILLTDNFGTTIGGQPSLSAAITTGTLLCAAIDLDNARCWFRSGAAGNWNGNAANNPATGVGGVSLAAVGLGQGFDAYPFAFFGASPNSITANFGGSAFTGTVPSTFTSGWDDSVAAVTGVVATQLAMEQWASGTTNQLQLTQILIEQWAAVATGNTAVSLTQIALEQWASVAQTGAAAAQAYAIIMA